MRYIKSNLAFMVCVSCLSILFSCKKKNETPSPSTTGGTATSGTNPNGVYGNFQIGYTDIDYGSGMLVIDSSAIASFYQSPVSSSAPTNIYAGTVTVNGNPMTFNSPQNYYMEPSHTTSMKNISWQATGSGTVSAFSYSYTPTYPTVASPISLPDTCYKSAGISVTLNGIANTSSGALVYVMQSSTIYKSIYTPNGTVNFSPAELSSFTANSPVYIQVLLTNINQQNVGSVKYQFTSTYTYMKYSYLK